MIGKRFRSLPFIFANDNYTLSRKDLTLRMRKKAAGKYALYTHHWSRAGT